MNFARGHVSNREADRSAKREAGKTHVPEEGRPRDFLDLEKNMTKYNVSMVGLSNIVAGGDTTAVSLSSFLWHLISNPKAMDRLNPELDQARTNGKMVNGNVKFKGSQRLVYLQACIKEGLRLCTAAALPLWREVPQGSGGVQILGHYLPEGTEVGVNTWVAHYDEDIWGSDAAHFRSERWIESDAEELKLMDSFFMPCGLDSRAFIGRNISFLEISKMISIIVSHFDFKLVNKLETFHTETYFAGKPTDLRLIIRPRTR